MRTDAPQPVLVLAAVLLAVGALLLVACPQRETKQQEWNDGDWGSVVPHDSFPADCGLCHITERWDVIREDFQFDHAKETGFALDGAHADASCLRCHNDRGPVQQFIEFGCAGCHVDPHQGALGTDCSACHGEMSWQPQGVVVAHQQTRFPLYGAHLAVACNLCHERADVGDLTGASVQCESCHSSLASTVTNPDHTSLGWLDNCEECHSSTNWATPHFHHDAFPLTGAHATADCLACHTTGVFSDPLPTDCYSCHTDDYNSVTTDHTAFGTNCITCHNTIAWVPSTFPHNQFFPLSGPHQLTCTACHTTPNNYTTFSCLSSGCHSQGVTDAHHTQVGGYSYDSPSCFSCHPTGKH